MKQDGMEEMYSIWIWIFRGFIVDARKGWNHYRLDDGL